jgi:hypothetical protein
MPWVESAQGQLFIAGERVKGPAGPDVVAAVDWALSLVSAYGSVAAG